MLRTGLFVACLFVIVGFAGCVEEDPDIVPAAMEYLRSVQRPDGGFAATENGSSDFATSAWVALAFGAAKADGASVESLRAFLRSQAGAVRNGTTGSLSAVNPVALYVLADRSLEVGGPSLDSLLLGFVGNTSLGTNERIFLLGALGRAGLGHGSLHAQLREEVANNRTSLVSSDAWFRAHAVLALLASGGSGSEPYFREAARTLLFFQKQGSGFRSSPEYEPDASTTAAVVAVLRKVPFVYSDEVNTGKEFLDGAQQPAGWIRFSTEADFGRTKTTAEAILGFTGAGPFGA